jgi:SAM-dependent methyltransferase
MSPDDVPDPADPTTRSQTDPADPTTRSQTDPADEPDLADGPDPRGDRHRSPAEIADLYADLADRLGRWSWTDRLVAGRYRRRQFGDVEGRVLDVACGTGTNFPYLPASVDLVGVDVSRAMLRNARAELDRLDRDGTLSRMDAADLAFPDDSFDAVVSAFATCTFPEPVAALREMRRVCRPDGRVRLLEHGRSGVGPLDRFLDWRADAHYERTGCRWNQDPLALVREAGLPVERTWSAVAGLLTGVEAKPAAATRPSSARARTRGGVR